jgi:hypothetical protein
MMSNNEHEEDAKVEEDGGARSDDEGNDDDDHQRIRRQRTWAELRPRNSPVLWVRRSCRKPFTLSFLSLFKQPNLQIS